MSVWFYKLQQNNLLHGGNIYDEKCPCPIIEGDWKWSEVKYWKNRWQYYQITELYQQFKPSVKKHLVTMPIIYD